MRPSALDKTSTAGKSHANAPRHEALFVPWWPRLLVILASLALLFSSFVRNAGAAERPNVLWIIAEDFSGEFGVDGVPELRTPNLDRLAKDGMRFRNAFATAPVCSASRSAFMTGMYQTTIGAHNHRSHRDDNFPLPDGVQLLTDRLRDAGYFTANLVHLTQNRKERFFRGTGKTDWNFTYEGKPFDSNRWSDLPDNQPFYAQVNFSETHRGHAWNTAGEHIEQPADPADVTVPPYYPDDPRVREDWAQYLNTAMALDIKVGRLLEKLEADGLAENTIVIFFSDHGRAMPRGKQWCYDSGLRVPLVVRWPKAANPPSQYRSDEDTDQLVELIDVTATTLAIAGVSKPASMQGRVFLGENADPPREFAHGARDRCDETVFRIRTVRNKRFRYIRNLEHERPFLLLNRYKEASYPIIPLMRKLGQQGKLTPAQQRLVSSDPRPREELYDLKTDPHETVNLAESSEHQSRLATMRQHLKTWRRETKDKGGPEDPAVVRQWLETMRRNYRKRLERQRKQWPEVYPLDPEFLNETWLPASAKTH